MYTYIYIQTYYIYIHEAGTFGVGVCARGFVLTLPKTSASDLVAMHHNAEPNAFHDHQPSAMNLF